MENWREEAEDIPDSDSDESGRQESSDQSQNKKSSRSSSDDEFNEKGEIERNGSSNEERADDSDFIIEDEVIVYHEDLDQALKGFRLDYVGKKMALGREMQDELEKRKEID